MKKVVRIITRMNVGGPAIHTVLLTALLNPSQYRTVLVSGLEGPTEGSMKYLATERGVELHLIPEVGREISCLDDITGLLKLMRLLWKEKPDIVHTHTAKAGTLGRLAALLVLFGRRTTLYHTFHGHVFHSYFSPWKTRIFIWIERILGLFTHRLIAVSERTKEELVAYGIAPADKIAVIPLGLDLDRFAHCEQHHGELRRELGLPEGATLIGLVARLVPVKGIHFFLQAARQVLAMAPDTYFLVVGDGELRAELEAQAQELGLKEKVRFLGFRQDLPRIYADMDVVALSSLNEGLPVSLIEAMSSARVVVSTAVGGVPNLIQDGETGYLAPPQDPEALAQAIKRALADRTKWQEVGHRAREFALTNFHINRLVADIEGLYMG